MVKVKKNFSFKRAAFLINKNIADSLNLMAVYQNEAIQRGIANKTDINGKRFDPLEESTLQIRNKRKQGFTPLDRMKVERSKKLRNTKIEKATQSKLISKVKMMTDYGVFHNEGFTTSSNSMIPNKKVPQRKWFGITKEMQPNGKEFKKAIKEIGLRIHAGWRKYGK